jgi:hypothetical protein
MTAGLHWPTDERRTNAHGFRDSVLSSDTLFRQHVELYALPVISCQGCLFPFSGWTLICGSVRIRPCVTRLSSLVDSILCDPKNVLDGVVISSPPGRPWRRGGITLAHRAWPNPNPNDTTTRGPVFSQTPPRRRRRRNISEKVSHPPLPHHDVALCIRERASSFFAEPHIFQGLLPFRVPSGVCLFAQVAAAVVVVYITALSYCTPMADGSSPSLSGRREAILYCTVCCTVIQ